MRSGTVGAAASALTVLGMVLPVLALPDGDDGGAPATWRVSVSSDERQANGESWGPAPVTAGARFVAFTSRASNLVGGDTNHRSDVFLRSRRSGTTVRVSVGPRGRQAKGNSSGAALSDDGRYVAFDSYAPNLVAGDTNGRTDVFVRDLRRGTTERVSVDSRGRQGDQPSRLDAMSADGRYVVFSSASGQLVPGDTNGRFDVFLRDRVARTTTRVSVSSSGAEGDRDSYDGDVSADGRRVVFTSWSPTLVHGDTNGESDVFLRDLATGTTTLVSTGQGGEPASSWSDSGQLSADGRRVSFVSAGRNLVPRDTNRQADAFVRDLRTGTTRRVSVGPGGREANGMTTSAAISSDGTVVVFSTLATNLARRPTRHVQDFVREIDRRRTRLVSRTDQGAVAADDCFTPSVSPHGHYVTFFSRAEDLVRGDTSGRGDIFVRHRLD